MPETTASNAMLAQLRKHANKQVEAKLTAFYNAFGPLDREELGAMMDGAQDAVMNWTPPKKKEATNG